MSNRVGSVAVQAQTKSALNWAEVFKGALIRAALTAVLGFLFIGLKAENEGSKMILIQRWELWATTIAIAFFGSVVASLAWHQIDQHKGTRQKSSKASSMGAFVNRNSKVLSRLAVAAAFAFPFAFITAPNLAGLVLYTVTTFMIYVMLGWGLNIVVGLAGLLDLGYVAFYAVGAYTYGLLATTFDFSFWICLPLAGIMAAFFGILLGFPVLRLRGDYLAIVTLGFGEIVRVVLINWKDFTGGSSGVLGIPKITFFGLPFNEEPGGFADMLGIPFDSLHVKYFLYVVILVLALLTNAFTLRMRKLPVGRAWEALREDEIACRSLGINPTNIKLSAFALGAMFAGFAGSFFAVRVGFISPDSFIFIESASILAIVVLGGMGSQIGVVIAAFVVSVIPELIREPLGEFIQFRMLIFGLAMVFIMVWRPRGVMSTRKPTMLMHPTPAQPLLSGGDR